MIYYFNSRRSFHYCFSYYIFLYPYLHFKAQAQPGIDHLQRQYDALKSTSVLTCSKLKEIQSEKDNLVTQVVALQESVDLEKKGKAG